MIPAMFYIKPYMQQPLFLYPVIGLLLSLIVLSFVLRFFAWKEEQTRAKMNYLEEDIFKEY